MSGHSPAASDDGGRLQSHAKTTPSKKSHHIPGVSKIIAKKESSHRTAETQFHGETLSSAQSILSAYDEASNEKTKTANKVKSTHLHVPHVHFPNIRHKDTDDKLNRTDSNPAYQGDDVIRQLHEAEQRAKLIIEAARTRRIETFKSARVEADKEIKIFEKELSSKMKNEADHVEYIQKEELQRLHHSTIEEIKKIDELAANNMGNTTDLLLDIILDVQEDTDAQHTDL